MHTKDDLTYRMWRVLWLASFPVASQPAAQGARSLDRRLRHPHQRHSAARPHTVSVNHESMNVLIMYDVPSRQWPVKCRSEAVFSQWCVLVVMVLCAVCCGFLCRRHPCAHRGSSWAHEAYVQPVAAPLMVMIGGMRAAIYSLRRTIHLI